MSTARTASCATWAALETVAIALAFGACSAPARCPDGATAGSAGCAASQHRTEVDSPPDTHAEVPSDVAPSIATPPPDSAAAVSATSVAAQLPPGDPVAPGMVRIAAGTFDMGSNDGQPVEQPVHRVKLPSFQLDATEVTLGQYRACVVARRCSTEGLTVVDSCNWGNSDREKHPINCVDWAQATTYCAWAGKRLPTEEEWEYAARAGDGRQHPWGDAAPSTQLCWSGEAGTGRRKSTCPVGSFAASPLGLFDLAGNVWEWTSTTYCSYEDSGCSSAAAAQRGGSWNQDYVPALRVPHRGLGLRSYRGNAVGFRCAR